MKICPWCFTCIEDEIYYKNNRSCPQCSKKHTAKIPNQNDRRMVSNKTK